ncbi:MAG: UvrD-helicase domain-containing protein [Anaerolineae bacterium]|nr:UvrD-helicase domain-containing protein [Anaerolineae bacterium]
MDYTDSQRAAIFTHDCNLIVTAGAGSGKTRVLVDRFVALLDTHPDWSLPSLVAITFTEKAAREMRDRVRHAVEDRIRLATEAQNDAEIQRWRAHEAALDSARIGTIHSLCASILRANTAEIGVDPRFEVLDDVESTLVRNDALDVALAQLAAGDTAQLLAVYGVNRVRRVLYEQMGNSVEIAPGPYLDRWQALYEQHVRQELDRLRHDPQFTEALRWQPANGWPDTADRLLEAWDLVSSTDHDLLDPDTPPPDTLNALQRLSSQINLQGGSPKVWGSKETLAEARARLRTIRERADEALEDLIELGEADPIAEAMLTLWAEAVSCARQVYADLKRSLRVLDFEDLESLTRRLLRNDEIASRYRGTEFQHILVDEFQDTNGAQRDIIYALAGLDRRGSLFVVGDPRQSIYAFRGADVSVFQQVHDEICASGGQSITLDTSFRSHTALVDGFNSIFARLLVRSNSPTAAYEVEMGQPMIAHRQSEAHHTPTIDMIVIHHEQAREGSASADDLRQWEAWELAQRLRQLVDNQQPVWDKQASQYRPIQYGDIAVLFQATTSMPLVEDIFKAADIPYVTVAGKGYYNRPEVWDLLNLLKALYNPFDDLSLAAALRSPLYNLSDDDLFALRLQELTSPPDPLSASSEGEQTRLSLWQVIMDADRVCDPALPHPDQVAFVRESLRRLHQIAGRVTVAELLSRILDETAFMATLSGLPDGARRCANVDKLLEVARRSGRIAVGEFTAYLDDLTTREAREGEAVIEAEGAVYLMTVHASKGLEFPVVALFDASWERTGHETLFVVDPQIGPACGAMDESGERMEPAPFALRLANQYAEARSKAERLRLLYVGMTRAQDYVIVTGHIGKKSGKGYNWLNRLMQTLGYDAAPGDPQIIQYDWGCCRFHCPTQQPDPVQLIPRAKPRSSGWDQLTGEAIPGIAPYMPPLLAPVPVDPQAPARILNASEIGVLGEAKAFKDPAKFRNRILHDAPTIVRTVVTTPESLDVPPHVIGNMVHQALQWWRLPSTTPNLRDVLDSYAWEQGLTDPQMIETAIEQATDLLNQTEASDIFQQIARASQVYRELPFTLQLGERTINGVIDVLFFSKYQRWNVVDYKTSAVNFADETERAGRIWGHARRYHAQVGVYAAAVEALTGQTPDVHLHYVRYVHTVKVPPDVWKGVLDNLDADIASALSE